MQYLPAPHVVLPHLHSFAFEDKPLVKKELQEFINKDSDKLLMDRISVTLVNNVNSLSVLSDATSEQRLEEVAYALRVPLEECEIMGMPGRTSVCSWCRGI